MPLLTPLEGQLLIAVMTIGYGVFVEKWYVGRSSIKFNVFTWLVLLFTLEISPWLLGGLAIWLLIGYAITGRKGHNTIKQFFGSKIFGSLAMVLGLAEYLEWELSTIGLLVVWGIVVVIVVMIGRKVTGKK